jgi:hypothetical protein
MTKDKGFTNNSNVIHPVEREAWIPYSMIQPFGSGYCLNSYFQDAVQQPWLQKLGQSLKYHPADPLMILNKSIICARMNRSMGTKPSIFLRGISV